MPAFAPLPPSRLNPTKVWLASFFVFWLLTVALMPSKPLNDPGSLWHLRVGEWIVAHRTFPEVDPFGYRDPPLAWRPQTWLAELMLAGTHALSYFDGVLAFMAVLPATLGATLVTRGVSAGLHILLAWTLATIPLTVASFHYYARPHVWTMFLLGLLMLKLLDIEAGRARPRSLWWWLPIIALWTNLHGGVLGGIFTLGLALAAWTVGWLLGRPGLIRSRRDLALGACLLAGWSAATLLNPFGLEMHRFWWNIVGSKATATYISEHQPLNLTHEDGMAVVALAAMTVLLLAGARRGRWPLLSLVPAVWFLLSLRSIRHGPLFAVTTAGLWIALFPESRYRDWLARTGDTLIRQPWTGPNLRRGVCTLAVAAWLTLVVALQHSGLPLPVVGAGWARLNPKEHPVDILPELKRLTDDLPDGTPIFNDANFGGFLIYLRPNLRVYMDDRCEMHTDAELDDYVRLMQIEPQRFEAIAARYPFRLALLQRDSALAEYLAARPGEWHLVAEGEKARLFERVGRGDGNP